LIVREGGNLSLVGAGQGRFADNAASRLGQIYDPTLGGMVGWRVGAMGMFLLLVIRHTRTEEESGRFEAESHRSAFRPHAIPAGVTSL